MKKEGKVSTKTLVLAAILTALVTVLQFMGAFIRFGPFSISMQIWGSVCHHRITWLILQ